MPGNSLCANCGTLLEGPYCSNCGQQRRDIRRFFLSMVNEAFEDIFKLNSRTWKTLFSLLFKPGFLTTEYLKGRRASYIHPVRLYIITSIIFFLLLSINNFLSNSPFSELRIDNPTQLEQSEPALDPTTPSSVLPDNTEPIETPRETNDGFPESEQEIDSVVTKNVDFDWPFASKESSQRLNELIRKQLKKAIALAKEETGTIKSALLELAPPVVFCLLPLFALLLKLGYISRGIYYAEHLVFAIHCHAFIFLALVFYTLLPSSFDLIHTLFGGAILLWMPSYLWLSLRTVYRQGKVLTSLKFVCLTLTYVFLLSASIFFALLVGAMTL